MHTYMLISHVLIKNACFVWLGTFAKYRRNRMRGGAVFFTSCCCPHVHWELFMTSSPSFRLVPLAVQEPQATGGAVSWIAEGLGHELCQLVHSGRQNITRWTTGDENQRLQYISAGRQAAAAYVIQTLANQEGVGGASSQNSDENSVPKINSREFWHQTSLLQIVQNENEPLLSILLYILYRNSLYSYLKQQNCKVNI